MRKPQVSSVKGVNNQGAWTGKWFLSVHCDCLCGGSYVHVAVVNMLALLLLKFRSHIWVARKHQTTNLLLLIRLRGIIEMANVAIVIYAVSPLGCMGMEAWMMQMLHTSIAGKVHTLHHTPNIK